MSQGAVCKTPIANEDVISTGKLLIKNYEQEKRLKTMRSGILQHFEACRWKWEFLTHVVMWRGREKLRVTVQSIAFTTLGH